VPGSASDRSPFSYLVLRVVPSVERGERINVGVVVFCRQLRFLGATARIDPARLAVLGPGLDADALAEHLTGLVKVAEGAPGAGPVAALPASERFGWLAAPSSTIVEPSEVHTGLCADPASTLTELHARLVN
jgi:hypothetical protein